MQSGAPRPINRRPKRQRRPSRSRFTISAQPCVIEIDLKKGITRVRRWRIKEKIMKKISILTVLVLFLGIGAAVAQEKVVVGGSGAMGDAIDLLAKAYKQKNTSEALEVIPEPMSTTGGIEGTKAG